jgi:hypothetical protein
MTLAEAGCELIAGTRDGSIPDRSGDRYKPATLRSYERSLRERVLPVLGHKRLAEIARAAVQDLADALTASAERRRFSSFPRTTS